MQAPLLQKTLPPGAASGRHASPVLYAAAAVVALVGLVDAVWLTVQELTGAVLTCGGSPDCSRVLGSDWAWIGVIPVAGLGVPTYFGVFSFSVFAAYGSRRAGQCLVALVAAMFLATLWLLFVQAFLLHAFCRYCLLSATVTFGLAGLVLCLQRRARRGPALRSAIGRADRPCGGGAASVTCCKPRKVWPEPSFG